MRYYLEKRDPDFETKMAQVLCVHQEVEMLKKAGPVAQPMVALLAYDEKPGIQPIASTGRDLSPRPDCYPSWVRDYEYVRQGTLSLLARNRSAERASACLVAERHRSREFIDLLKKVDGMGLIPVDVFVASQNTKDLPRASTDGQKTG